jgi:hypothetical protein
MTREPRLPRQAPGCPCMRRACHEHLWPGLASLRACDRETKPLGRAPATLNATMAATALSGGLDLLPAVVGNAPILAENSIGGS